MRVIGVRPSTWQMLSGILLSIVIFFCVWMTVTHTAETVPVHIPYRDRPQVILDAGHGGMDGGAVGINNVAEKGINLSITLKLAELLRLNGFDVILTRSTDDSIHDTSETTVARQKRSDMYNRKEIIEKHPNALFLSIHQNKFSDPSVCGAQVFYSPNHGDSELLAECIQKQLREQLQPDNSRETKRADEGLFLLWNSEIPAVLIECGFLSNQNECEQLCDGDYQNKIAFVIYLSLLDFYELSLERM